MAQRKSTRKTSFRSAIIIDKARRDIGAKFAGRVKGKTLFATGRAVGSTGVIFTGKELARAKKRALRVASGKSLK